jgi:glycosyltransferase involved in cell wall biosynthesis
MKLKSAKVIYLNGRFLTQSLTGVQRHALELVKGIDRLIDSGEIDLNEFHFILIHPKGIKYKPNLKHIIILEKGILTGNLWEQIELPIYTFNKPLLSMCMVSSIFKFKQIVIVQDASCFVNKTFFTKLFRYWYILNITLLGKTSKHIITISEFSKNELVKYAGMKANKITVTYLSSNHMNIIEEANSDFKNKIKSYIPYVLGVSSMSPNKNFKGLVESISILENKGIKYKVIVAGGANPKVFNKSIDFGDSIQYLGYVTDEELRTLYENASLFVYPSFYEGFGIPPLEAMYFNCPVVVSDTSAMPEVCKDSAVYCDPNNSADIAQKIDKLMNNKHLLNNLRIKGQHQVLEFSWYKCSKQTFDVIKNTFYAA